MKKLKYNINSEGIVSACGYDYNLPYEVGEDTPFKTIAESQNYKLIKGVWEWYDITWTYPEFKVRVTIPETIILDTFFYRQLSEAVLELIAYGLANQEVINNNRVMYFNQIQAEHLVILESDINVIIENQ